jgi:hypothetical protein
VARSVGEPGDPKMADGACRSGHGIHLSSHGDEGGTVPERGRAVRAQAFSTTEEGDARAWLT